MNILYTSYDLKFCEVFGSQIVQIRIECVVIVSLLILRLNAAEHLFLVAFHL